MRLSDLQNKDIVSILDGRNIGNIIDVKINPETGVIASLVVEAGKSFGKLFNKDVDTEIKWEEIAKIGEDVILVKKV